MLGVLLHAPRGPFYSPKAARSRWEHSRKAIPAFCRLAHRTLSGADFFPSLAKPTVGDSEPLAHRTLSGAHWTVRCPLLTVGSATRRTRITRPTVGPADCWLTGQSGAHRTVRWILAVRRRWFSESGQFARASLVHPNWVDFWLLRAKLFQLNFLWF
jgi:hypothetical protein